MVPLYHMLSPHGMDRHKDLRHTEVKGNHNVVPWTLAPFHTFLDKMTTGSTVPTHHLSYMEFQNHTLKSHCLDLGMAGRHLLEEGYCIVLPDPAGQLHISQYSETTSTILPNYHQQNMELTCHITQLPYLDHHKANHQTVEPGYYILDVVLVFRPHMRHHKWTKHTNDTSHRASDNVHQYHNPLFPLSDHDTAIPRTEVADYYIHDV